MQSSISKQVMVKTCGECAFCGKETEIPARYPCLLNPRNPQIVKKFEKACPSGKPK